MLSLQHMYFQRQAAVRKTGVNRIDGDPECHVIYFLPWQTPYAVAKACGLLPLSFAACYEMPRNVVSGDPLRSLARLEEIVDDAQERISRLAQAPLIIGFSIGTVPATCLANRHRAPLLSICSAPRGADIIWQSPLARPIKHHAIALGFTRGQFRTALRRIDPANNLARLPEGSAFVAGAGDKGDPPRTDGRMAEAGRHERSATFHQCDTAWPRRNHHGEPPPSARNVPPPRAVPAAALRHKGRHAAPQFRYQSMQR